MSSIIGYYTTQFGELWDKSLFDLAREAISGVLQDCELEKNQIDAVFYGNMMAGVLENNLHGGAKIAQLLGTHVPIFRVESACASGGMAFHLAHNYILAGKAETVLVLGAEKMTDYPPEVVVQALAAAASGEEQEAGLTFAGLYALIANYYFSKYNVTEEDLAHVSVKNHFHGSLNEKAQFKNIITVQQVLKSSYVASPLKVLDSSPISDGACAVVITSNKQLLANAKNKVEILASEVATDALSLKDRAYFDRLEATSIAAKKAFEISKVKIEDINVAEVHDCFSIAEVLALEDIGFCKKGTGAKFVAGGKVTLGESSSFVVNTSGGLKAAGHPVGATGVKQIGEIFLQLTGRAQKRQVKNAHTGLAHNVGGSGGTVVVTILSNKN